MVNRKILLTSFQTWLPHQKTNSSDDLLMEIQKIYLPKTELIFLRNLPVNIEKASVLTVEKINQRKPHFIICCGMAETSLFLHIESQAFDQDQYYQTTVNLTELIKDLKITTISHDAGKFVCEGLYFQVLKHLKTLTNTQGLFIHVPILTQDNQSLIIDDFVSILDKVKSN